MNLSDWLQKYDKQTSDMDARCGIDEFHTVMKSKKVFLWGAGNTVRRYLDLFDKVAIPVAGLIDKQKHGELVEEFHVLPPSELLKIDNPSNAVVISSVGSLLGASQIDSDFIALNTSLSPIISGLHLFNAIQYLICLHNTHNGNQPAYDLCILCKSYGSLCPILTEDNKDDNDLVVNDLTYLIGSVCTLKCEHCIEGVPYIQNVKRGFVDIEIIKEDIDLLLKICTHIIRFDITGGETFLHPQLVDIVKLLLNAENIEIINIYSNGTVIPDDPICAVLCNDRVKVTITDYTGELTPNLENNITKTLCKLSEYGISIEHRRHTIWSNINSFEQRCLSKQQLENAYQSCQWVKCRIIHKGIIYPCVHYYTGVQIDELTCNHDECLHIHKIPECELKEAMHSFLNRSFLSACNHCMSPFDLQAVPTARQLIMETSNE